MVGENGAGKSTLMKVLYGLVPRDGGRILLEGRPVSFRGPEEAIARGIGMVHQEILLVQEYTVWQNVVLGAEPVRRPGPPRREGSAPAGCRQDHRASSSTSIPMRALAEISVAARQKVEILKLLYRNVSVLILDEPTAVLDAPGGAAVVRGAARACATTVTPSSSFRTGSTRCSA